MCSEKKTKMDCYPMDKFGKIEIDGVMQPDGYRVVSFFKDEPIAGAYISGFLFLLIGIIFTKFNKNNLSKFLSFLFLAFFDLVKV